MSGRRLLNMREVGERLGHGYHWFRKRRRAMERDEGFPGPIRTCGLRWDGDAIDRWIAAQGKPTVSIDIGDGPIEVADLLDQRARRIGAGMH